MFEKYGIEHMPAFLFVVESVILHTLMQAIITSSGLQPETVRKYVDVVRSAMRHATQKMYRSWEGQLGGPGKVVEIDEAFPVKNKYHVGRILAKQGLIVFGITERDGGRTKVDDVGLFNYLVKKEADKTKKELAKHPAGLRQPQTRRTRARRAVIEPQEPDTIVVDEDTQILILDEENGAGIDSPDPDENEEPVSIGRGEETPFEINVDFERAEHELFGPKTKTQPHRSLFFVVKDRSARTLIPIIKKYVAPETTIFTDKWLAYNELKNRYDHFTVVHKRRFVKYHFFPGGIVVKVTTNHIERLWVEVRRDLKGVERATMATRLDEVAYRMMRLSTGDFNLNFENLIKDMVRFIHDQTLRGRGSAFETSVPVNVND